MSDARSTALRTVLGGILAFGMSLVLAALVTFDAFGYWGNFVTQLLAFVATGFIVSRIATRWPAWTVGISLGATWGLIVLVVVQEGIRTGGPMKSAGAVTIYIVAATLAAAWSGRRRHARQNDGAAKASTSAA